MQAFQAKHFKIALYQGCSLLEQEPQGRCLNSPLVLSYHSLECGQAHSYTQLLWNAPFNKSNSGAQWCSGKHV